MLKLYPRNPLECTMEHSGSYFYILFFSSSFPEDTERVKTEKQNFRIFDFLR